MLDEHREPIEADLQAVYGLHIADVGTPRFTWGRLATLLEMLPPTSALSVTLHGVAWTTTDYLLRGVLAALGGPRILSPAEQRTKLDMAERTRDRLERFEADERKRRGE